MERSNRHTQTRESFGQIRNVRRRLQMGRATHPHIHSFREGEAGRNRGGKKEIIIIPFKVTKQIEGGGIAGSRQGVGRGKRAEGGKKEVR
mmetsp:Transcript_39765/g.78346  ORF Transcript_39765/g.78346 Transcript_39765/m.78346 type:complete len:90 (+) Transcript_39765:3000-3269(+)